MISLVRVLGLAAVVVSAASCGGGGGSTITGVGGGGGGGGGNTPTDCTTGTFCMGAATFVPTSATVAKNVTVTWVNNSGIQHNVTFDNPPAPVVGGDIATINTGTTASRTFATAGTYPFHCNIHSGMNGTLTVQ